MDANADPLLNHKLAQQIYREETIRVAQGDLTALAASQEDESDLQGESLTYKQCRQLCGNHFVLHTLFRISGNAKGSAPKNVRFTTYDSCETYAFKIYIGI